MEFRYESRGHPLGASGRARAAAQSFFFANLKLEMTPNRRRNTA
jgi:hypothetical protein